MAERILKTKDIIVDSMIIFRLRLGALLHFLIAIGHLGCLFFLEEALDAYGILDEMRQLCLGQDWLLYVVTVGLALAFALAGVYALAVSGDFRKFPLQRFAMLVIVGLYGVRSVVGILWLLNSFSYLELFSTMVPALLVWCYLPGVRIDR